MKKNATVSALASIGTRMFSGTHSNGLGPYSESALKQHPGSTLFQLKRRTFRGNRWLPHNGAKQRARFANWPDGDLHRTTAGLRSNAAKRIDNVHRLPGRALVGSGPDHLAASAVQVAQNAFDNYEDITHAASDAARAAPTVGTQVEWTSSNTRKIGDVTCVIPPGQTPSDFTINAGGGGASRDHESYVVRARSVSNGGVQGTAKNYWPVVSLLTLTARV